MSDTGYTVYQSAIRSRWQTTPNAYISAVQESLANHPQDCKGIARATRVRAQNRRRREESRPGGFRVADKLFSGRLPRKPLHLACGVPTPLELHFPIDDSIFREVPDSACAPSIRHLHCDIPAWADLLRHASASAAEKVALSSSYAKRSGGKSTSCRHDDRPRRRYARLRLSRSTQRTKVTSHAFG